MKDKIVLDFIKNISLISSMDIPDGKGKSTKYTLSSTYNLNITAFKEIFIFNSNLQ